MELNTQILRKGSEKEFAVLPYKEFLKLKEMLEDYEDLLCLRQAKSVDKKKKGKSVKTILNEMELI
jgi:hypothetical protein